MEKKYRKSYKNYRTKPRNSRRKRISKRKPRKSFYKRRSKRRLRRRGTNSSSSLRLRRCKNYLNKKIRINMDEWKNGKFVSQRQALAVSYNQTLKKYPNCYKYL